jgi:hypothetical protein
MTDLDRQVEDLKNLLSPTAVRLADNGKLYFLLSSILTIVTESEPDSIPISNATLSVLDEACTGKAIALHSRTHQALLVSIYTRIVQISVGHIIRSVLSSMLVICNTKSSLVSSKECATLIMSAVLEFKFNDCGSQVNESLLALTTMSKVSTATSALRVNIVKCLSSVVIGGGGNIHDLYAEIVKMAARLATDKLSPEVREQVAILIKEMSRQPICTIANYEPLSAIITVRGGLLEDDNAVVQDAAADALAAIFVEQINKQLVTVEQAKFGLARGVDDETPPTTTQSGQSSGASSQSTPGKGFSSSSAKQSTLSRTISFTTKAIGGSSTKKAIEEFEFKAVVEYIIKQVCVAKSTATSRAGYFATLGHLVTEQVPQLNQDDFEWLTLRILSILHQAPSNLSYPSPEELCYLRTRISHLIRSCMTALLNEANLLLFAGYIMKLLSNVEAANAKTEIEIQLALSELNQVIQSLGAVAVALMEEWNTMSPFYLRHASHGIRHGAAAIIASLSVLAPAVAVDFLTHALSHAKSQAKHLIQLG